MIQWYLMVLGSAGPLNKWRDVATFTRVIWLLHPNCTPNAPQSLPKTVVGRLSSKRLHSYQLINGVDIPILNGTLHGILTIHNP